jgi:thiamine kinase-like enzyme
LADRCRGVLPGRARVFCHVDPWFGNFLLGDDGHLVALLDFENAACADPAVDLAAQVYLAPAARDRLLAAYLELMGPLADLNERIRGWRLLRELDGLAYCLRNDHDELEDTVKMLRAALSE